MSPEIGNICGLIDNNLASLLHTMIVLIKLGVPLVLVFLGMLDLAKGVIASKEDEMKKGQGVFIKRLICAIIVFFVVTVVQLVIGLVDDESDGDVWKCAQLILNGKQSTYKEEFREYDKVDAYCCKKAHGELNENNFCHDYDGHIYDECLKNPPDEAKK